MSRTGVVLGETFRETLPSPPFGMVKLGRWKLKIINSQANANNLIIRYAIHAEPIGSDRRTPQRLVITIGERYRYGKPSYYDREHDALKEAYAQLKCGPDFHCCVKHLMLRRYDGSECVGM